MATMHQLSPKSTRNVVENVIVAGVGVVLAGAAAVFLAFAGMFAAVVWFH